MDWLTYYEGNRERNRDQERIIPWDSGIRVEPNLRQPLIRSLQRFQIGETGEGKHLRAGAASTGDTTYQRIIDLFIAEENAHADLLAKILHGLDAKLLSSHWSDTVFVWLRRLMGLRLELMILLVAEMIARRYYKALYEGTRDSVLRMVFGRILRDEVGHVAFHADFLRETCQQWSMPVRLLVCSLWWLVYRTTCLIVMLDHGSVFRACRVSPRDFWEDTGRIFDGVAGHIFFRPLARPVRASFRLGAD